jgi:hypothetical protein
VIDAVSGAVIDKTSTQAGNFRRRRVMTNQLQRTTHTRVYVAILSLTLVLLSLPVGPKAMTNPSPAPTDSCIVQAFVKIEKVLYQDRINGQDVVHVEWSQNANSSCIGFGGGFDVPGKSDIPPFGNEVTVKIRRRGGHEDVGTVKGSAVGANKAVSSNVYIPRATLETDPVSYEVNVRTTAGAVMARTVRLTGNGAPSLSGATQTSSNHSTMPSLSFGTCGPTLQVSALNFIPGAGPKPDRVTINWTAGLPPAASCFDPPKVAIVVRVTRPNGVVDSGQVNVDAGTTTSTITLPGTPGTVASFEILVTATVGSVVEKVSTSSGPF